MHRLSIACTIVLLFVAGCAPRLAAAQTVQRVIDIPVSGHTQRALYLSPPKPRASIVMLPGGSGNIGIAADGSIARGKNFLVRSRALWVAEGFAVLIPDAVDGANLRGLRSSPQYAGLIGALVAAARAQAPGPVFLIGTSQGAIAAMNGAAHLRNSEIAGVVLSESVSVRAGSHESVFDVHPGDVNVPALVVANSDDRCFVAPPQDAAKIAAAMVKSPSAKVLNVSGGEKRSKDDCGSLTPHGYFGIEAMVVKSITAWMKLLI